MWESLKGIKIEDETGEEYEINEVNSVKIDGVEVEDFGKEKFEKVNWESLSAGISKGNRTLLLRGKANVMKDEGVVSLREYQEVTIAFN